MSARGEFDRLAVWMLPEWVAVTIIGVLFMCAAATTHITLHDVPTPDYPTVQGVWCRTPDGGLVHRDACT